VDREPVRVEHRTHHRQTPGGVAADPLGRDRDDAAGGLEAGRDRLDQDADLLGAGRVDERVDPALGVEQPLRAQAEHEQHGRSGGSGMVPRRGGHKLTLVRGPAAGPSRVPGWMTPCA
jgi:hypothetical protein